MRLIDADALMEELIDELGDGEVLYSIPPDCIDDAPTVDAVAVVRCNMCIHYETDTGFCNFHCGGMDWDGFCSRGAKMDGDADGFV